ncbi:MAG: glycosyltransferase family 9 protein [Elusimicrobia bacterium]|nr:glycosyltransferase family 9 protein [Elusimicrobiota bacterium]
MTEKILIIVLRAIGDVLLTTPLIRALKKSKPESKIYFLTQKSSEIILKYNPYISGVILLDKNTLKNIKERKFDIVIDFMNSAITGYYTLLSGADKRVAFYRPWGFWCYNIMPKYVNKGYTVFDRLQILETFGIKYENTALDLSFGAENEKKVLSYFNKNNISNQDFLITFDITNRRTYRQWSKEKFAQLADLVADKLNAKVIFIWGPGELDYVQSAMSLCKKKHLLCDDFNILDLAALIKSCKLHIGTSSAPAHIAVSQNTPSFIIYGLKTNPVSWTYPNDNIHKYIQGQLDSLSVDEVAEKLFSCFDKSLYNNLENVGRASSATTMLI